MGTQQLKKRLEHLLQGTGVGLNGAKPWDLQVLDERLYARVLAQGNLGLGEGYMDGWWESAQIDEMISRILKSDVRSRLKPSTGLMWDAFQAKVVNRQNKQRAFEIGRAHYDIGNDLYTAMLDKRLTYTCGYWEHAQTLDQAQEAKLDLVCKKIGLKAGQQVLDIGCGWGSFAKFAAEKYGARVTGITVSVEQVKLGKALCAGLPVEIRLQDYRDVQEKFDHVISLGMFEHVGYKNYNNFFQVARRCLKDEGIFLLHTVGGNVSTQTTDTWISKYIFPNSMLPSISQIGTAIEGKFVMEDWQNFSADYDTTLMHWFKNVESHWEELKGKYSDRFFRIWKYYLLSCAGSFRSRSNQLWQIVLSPQGIPGGFRTIDPRKTKQ